MEYQDIIFEVKDRVATITVNRPEVLNALRNQTKDELEHAIEDIAVRSDIFGVIITGAGRAFISGNDISELDPKKDDGSITRAMSVQMHRILGKLESLGKPVIAAINGYAFGGGTELSLACDLRIAGEKAIFSLPEVKLGGIPCFSGTQRLPRIIGTAMAKELLYTARNVSAEEAARIGLINKVVPQESVMEEAEALMASILKNAPLGIQACKELVAAADSMSLEEGLALETDWGDRLCKTEDKGEGIQAFFEKRPPVFQGK